MEVQPGDYYRTGRPTQPQGDACLSVVELKRLVPVLERLGMAVELSRDATIRRLEDAKAGYSARQTEKATAADLSQELSAPEIDAWLDP